MLFRNDTTRLQNTIHSHSHSVTAESGNDCRGPGWSGWWGHASDRSEHNEPQRSARSARKGGSRIWKAGNGSDLRPGDGESTAIVRASSASESNGFDGLSQKEEIGPDIAARDGIHKQTEWTTEWTVLPERGVQY
jgi:hypothetical protein